MTKIKFLLVLFSCFLLLAGKIFAQGEAAVPFLTEDTFVKGIGMAGAMTSVAHDASANFYNPACLVRTKRFSGEIGYLGWSPRFNVNDISFFQTSVAFTIPKAGSFGIYFMRIDFGENDWYNELGQVIATYDPYEWTLSIGYAYKFSNSMALGLNVKLIRSVLFDHNISVGMESGDGKAIGYAFDLGFLQQNILSNLSYKKLFLSKPYSKWLMHRQPSGISVGLAISNIGPDISYIDEAQADPLPQNLRLGLSWNYLDTDIIGLITSIDIQKLLVKKDRSGKADTFYEAWFSSWGDGGYKRIRLSIGQKISIMSVMAIRLGYYDLNLRNGHGKYFTFGLSWGPETLCITTAWTENIGPKRGTGWYYDETDLSDTFTIGLSTAY